MTTFNLKSIMSDAWQIYRANLTDDGIRPIFSICLSMAWDNAKATPENIIQAWADMDERGQIQILTACVKKAAKNEIKFSTEDNYNSYNESVAWFLRDHGIDDLVNEAYCKLAPRLSMDYLTTTNARRADKGLAPLSLVALVYRSAKDAIRCVYRDDIKHGCASVRTIKGKDGEEYSYIDTMAMSHKDNTENAAVIHATLDSFMHGRDEIDRIIIEGKRDGYTERELAAIVGISGPAIHKRIDKIRAALQLQIA